MVHRHRAWTHGVWVEALATRPDEDGAAAIARLTLLHDGGPAGSKASRSPEPVRLARTPAAAVLQDHSAAGALR